MQAIINQQVDALLEQGCIKPSRSPHSAPLVLVRKKTGKWRMCVDYRQLNARSIPDAYPLPRINHILERLGNATFISALDLTNYSFFQQKLTYLGHVISNQGIHTDPEKVAASPIDYKFLVRISGTTEIHPGQRTSLPGMHRDARAHVRKCEICMRFKPNQMQAAGKMLTQVPEEPWATVCADFVGPLPRSKHGNQLLLVLIDRFSKCTE
ncbi:hypothetical protein KR084_005230 [Drosophila pseudotakahashii]|nr:hypothetical protein KR084_005230 [Drosophila pseudotakahashii]